MARHRRYTVMLYLLMSITISAARAQSLLGFGGTRADEERALERKFDVFLNKDDQKMWMHRMSAQPHHIGSAFDKENLEYVASLFRSWGFQTSIETFYVLFPTPKVRTLELLEPAKFAVARGEPEVEGDTTSRLVSEELPLYNAYSPDGDVRGELVYVNYGVPADYDELQELGVDVKGKIVIARYGGSWRGIKPKVAAEHGAVGCIIYSDPRDDGYFEGDVYPKGAFRNNEGGQRGSVLDMPVYSGDPLTPGIGATKDARRLPRDSVTVIPKIPVLPISYHDALPLLQAMSGPVAPEPWRGALPITYHCGAGPALVHLKVQSSWDLVPIYDVIAKIQGSTYPDEWVIRGNHEDAWVFGAGDPLSGLVGLLAEAQAVGKLAGQGWKPKRTMVYCVWDGEEEGLFGSTEWVETHFDELRQKAALYVNTDGSGRGFLGVAGSHTLQRFVSQVARDVRDPEYGVSVFDRLRARMIDTAPPEELESLRARPDLPIGALGSGSDYTPFLQHLGIAALNVGYGGEDGGGSYHSAYDSYDYYVRFGDPTFSYEVALAQTTGRMMLRCADADILPFEFTDFTETVKKYISDVVKLADNMRNETHETNRRIEEHTLLWNADPTKTFVVPAEKAPVPFLNFAPLQNALATLEDRTQELRGAFDSAGAAPSKDTAEKLDLLLKDFEHSLTLAGGLPGRPWYVHEIYAPGRYTGYGVKTLPAIREAIELREWGEADNEIGVVSNVLTQSNELLAQIHALVSGNPFRPNTSPGDR